MSVRSLLASKKDRLFTCRPEDTVETAASLLTTNQIGALPVRDAAGSLVGMISERDVVRGVSDSGARALSLQVKDLMSREVITCRPDDTVKSVMEKMSRRHIRHLPVVEGGGLVGIISQRDVMQQLLEQTQLEANVLRDYLIAKR